MSEELLYTQEDIDEWMRACDELQVHLRELEDNIKAKDKQLQELEEREDRMSFIFYVALNKQFERAGMVDNIPSAIEQLVGAKCGKYANAYSEYKCLKRDVAIYKRAFELAKLDGLEMDGYIVEAKKELEEEDAED